MFKILCRRNPFQRLSRIRKYSNPCPEKSDYACARDKPPKRLEMCPSGAFACRWRTWSGAPMVTLGYEVREVHPFLKEEDCKSPIYWRNIVFFVCLPALIASFFNFMFICKTPKRPPFREYPYLRIMTRPFPWRDGQKPLFYNPHRNALPTGYETEEEDDD